ncbi:hypothetical protein MTR67_029866 [Solanum verrucosum]|uniref:RNase H type-1 domain-containing protein n=1 Tax=Solanum verrucosum TaxID=315347 RepID=A0AAF0R6N9_SOLVR|nr:hypothetical protein MTR67_029866 [Solanum verrucosum]
MDDQVAKLGINIVPGCYCCVNIPDNNSLKTADHLFCKGNFAKYIWRSIVNSLGITRRKFGKVNIGEMWRSLSNIFDANIHQHISNPVKWIKLPARTFKLNSDGSCLQGACGGGGLIRDSFGHTIFAYSINLRAGTSNMTKTAALLYGLKWCADKGLTNVWGLIDSLLLVRGLINMDMWEFPSFRMKPVKPSYLVYEPP